MKLFNAFQVVIIYALLPFLIGWLSRSPFPYSPAAFWVSIATYVIGTGCMITSVYDSFCKMD